MAQVGSLDFKRFIENRKGPLPGPKDEAKEEDRGHAYAYVSDRNTRMAYYRADVQGLNAGDAATRTLDPLDGKEYTYATTQVDLARAIAARHADFCVYRVILDEPIEADPDAARDNLGGVFVRSPWGVIVHVVGENET